MSPHVADAAPGTGALVVKGTDDLAPGLLGLRSGTTPLTALDCTVPTAEQWFTGLGARADHDSVIELVNPDGGPAVAEITLYGDHAVQQQAAARAHHPRPPDGLDRPRRRRAAASAISARVVSRAAASASRSSTAGPTWSPTRPTSEWLPRQLEPAPVNDLLGLPTGAGSPAPSSWPTPATTWSGPRSRSSPATPGSRPRGWRRSSVPPGSTVSVSLTKVLAKALGDGAVGVAVPSDAPITASVLSQLGTRPGADRARPDHHARGGDAAADPARHRQEAPRRDDRGPAPRRRRCGRRAGDGVRRVGHEAAGPHRRVASRAGSRA